jgi:arylsulfatase A-like enzyme
MISEGVLGEHFIEITDRAIDAVRTWEPHLLLVVFYVGDTFSHLFGPEADETLAAIEEIDAMTARILNAYADRTLLDDTVAVVLADHGHARVDAVVPTDVVARVGALPHGRLALAPRAFSNDEMRTLLADPHVDDVYTREELHLLGAGDKAWGEHVVLLAEGFMFPHPRAMKMLGYHGGLTEAEWHIPLILSGPGIVTGARLDDCEIIDLAPTMSALLGGTLPEQSEGRILWEVLDARRPRSTERYQRLWCETPVLLEGWRRAKRAWARGDMDHEEFVSRRTAFREQADTHVDALRRAWEELNAGG